MGSGALVATATFLLRSSTHKRARSPEPNAVVIRIHAGVDPAAAYRSLEVITTKIDAIPGDAGAAGGVVSVLRRRDCQLPLDGDDSCNPQYRTGTRRRCRVGPHARRVGPAPPPRPRFVEDARFHPTPGGRRSVWQSSVGIHRHDHRCADWHYHRAVAVVLFADEINAVPAPTVPSALIAVMVVGALVARTSLPLFPDASPPARLHRCY